MGFKHSPYWTQNITKFHTTPGIFQSLYATVWKSLAESAVVIVSFYSKAFCPPVEVFDVVFIILLSQLANFLYMCLTKRVVGGSTSQMLISYFYLFKTLIIHERSPLFLWLNILIHAYIHIFVCIPPIYIYNSLFSTIYMHMHIYIYKRYTHVSRETNTKKTPGI